MINKFKEWSKKHNYTQTTDNAFLDFNFQAWQAGYELAKEEQDSNITCDHCCDELGMNDGSVRLCRVCNTGTIYNHAKLEVIDSKRADTEINLNRQFKETFDAGYALAKEEQDSDLNAWISVQNRLPEKDGHYLIYSVNKCVFCDQFDVESGFFIGNNYVTHWKPMPEPPEE